MQNKSRSKITLQIEGDSSYFSQPTSYQIYKQKKLIPFTKYDPIKTLQTIHTWRGKNQAPVDVVGCQVLADSEAPIELQKYQILIALMLSIQTRDEITGMVVERLKKYGLQPKKIANIDETKLIQLIRESNFNKRKAKHIKEVSTLVVQNGLPKTKQELIKLPGIGIKIAMIYMRAAEGKLDGIGVDTHVHRISNRLGWVRTKEPNQSEDQLQNLFPRKYWTHINVDLVGFGQIMCSAKAPKCEKCPVNDVCPSAQIL